MTRSDRDNQLGALLDGRLAGPEREEALARLSASDEDAQDFADAAAVLRQLEAEDGTVVVDEAADEEPPPVHEAAPAHDRDTLRLRPPSTRRAWRRPPARWLALAAVLVGVLLVFPPSRWGRDPAGPGEFVALLADREAGLPDGWNQRPWPSTRSEGDPLTDTEVGRAARLGILWVDLELAAASGQADTAGVLCARVERLLAAVPAGGAVGLHCARVVAEPSALRETGVALAARFEHEPHFALGAWAEAARLAARREDAGFFASRRSRRALGRFATSDDLAPAARESAQQVRGRLAGGARDWGGLRTDLDKLLVVAHQPASPE